VKQGCVILPTLFTIYVCVLLFLVRDRLPRGVEIDYRLVGRRFYMRRLKTKTKVTKPAIIDLQYADECAIIAITAEDLQTGIGLLTETYLETV